MTADQNPYPELLFDEVSGIEALDTRHKIWTGGYRAGRKDKQVIKYVIKTQNGMVLIFDDKGEQISEYQGQYEQVRFCILRDAPANAVFCCVFNYESELITVPREEW